MKMMGMQFPMEMMGGESRPRAPATPHDALARTLLEIAARYDDCPFKRGDLITPRPGYNLRGAGEPCVVLEVYQDGQPDLVERDGEGSATRRCDIRYACERNGDIMSFLGESWAMEPWTGEVALTESPRARTPDDGTDEQEP